MAVSSFVVSDLVLSIHTEWRNVLWTIFKKKKVDVERIERQIQDDMSKGFKIYPPPQDVFAAFKHFEPHDLRVVIVGQDPYHNEGEANGLCFSVNPTSSTKMPPSLRNIFKELEWEYGLPRVSMDLTDWANQGILLLNRTLTVRQASPNSHKQLWHMFTEGIIEWVVANTEHVVFILWGNDAKACRSIVDQMPQRHHHILEHTHPSPLSRKPFVGNNHFRLCNDYLVAHNKPPIYWQISTTTCEHA